MKIIRTAEQAAAERKAKEFAESKCNICPFCDENISAGEAFTLGYGFSRGVSSFNYTKYIRISWFRLRARTVTRYECNRCGAIWESDPY